MAEKQSLYELLGLNSKALPEQIRQAYEDCCRKLEAEPDGEERRNRAAFLQNARDVLSDPRRRAHYDHQRRQAAAGPPVRRGRSTIPWLVAALAAAAVWPAWRLMAPEPVPAPIQPPLSPAPVATAQAATEPLPMVEDPDALLPATGDGPAAGSSAAPQTARTPPPPQQRLTTDAANAGVLAKFIDSTYLIIGSQGFGTGVVIDSDRLLTNCHVIAPNVLKGPIYAISPVTQERTRIVAAAFLVREDACVVHAPGLGGRPIAMGDASRLPRGANLHNVGFADGRLISSRGQLLGLVQRPGQTYLASSNYCDHGVSGGPLVDDEGRLVGLTSGGTRDHSICLSLTAETARQVLAQTLIAIDAFPTNYMSNLSRRW